MNWSQYSKANYMLFMSIESGDLSAMRSALSMGANVNCLDKTWVSPLIAAIFSKKISLIEILIKAGADVNLADPETGNSPLAFASFSNDANIFKLLISSGANPEATNSFGVTVRELVEHAGQNDFTDMMESVTTASTSKRVERFNVTFIPKAAPWPREDIEAASARLASGKLMEMTQALGQIANASFAESVDEQAFEIFTASVRAGLAKSGFTPQQLAEATLRHAPDAASTHVFSADHENALEEECNDIGTAFERSCAFGRTQQIAFWSAAFGVDWNPDGMSPPMAWAIYGQSISAARQLLELGANPNLSSHTSGATHSETFEVSQYAPLHLAISEGQHDIALMLLGAGSLATGTDRASLKALRAAIDEKQRLEVIGCLGAMLTSDDMSLRARGVGGLGALCACGWTRDADFEPLVSLARESVKTFGADFGEACRHELSTSSHMEVEFEAILERRGKAQPYSGSIQDRAAATGLISTLEFFASCVGPDWNPEGGDRPIDWAANVGDARAIKSLAGMGAELDTDPLSIDGKSSPPLARATMGHWRDASALLLELGADPAALVESEVRQVFELLGSSGLAAIEARAIDFIKSDSPDECYFGLRQIWNLAKAGWVSRWDVAHSALDELGFPQHFSLAPSGLTQAGESLLREGGYLESASDISNPLGGHVSFFSKLVCDGDTQATRFLARSLGADFRHPNDNGTPLANAIATRQFEAAQALIAHGAHVEGDPSPLVLAARNQDGASFLMLVAYGAKSSTLSGTDRALVTPVLSYKSSQQALATILPTLAPEEDGFDSFLAPGSLSPAAVLNWVTAGQKERFWRNRNLVDWSRDVSALVNAAHQDGEAGLAAYATFRRAISADDIDAASACVTTSPALLASLSKRGLVDESIMVALGAGRSGLMRAMTSAGWPMESTMREHATEALTQAASSKDVSMFEHLLPLIPADGSLDLAAQTGIGRAAWKLGGLSLLTQFDSRIGGMAPQAIEACRDLFTGVDGERAFAQIALDGIKREATRSRALDKQSARSARRTSYFALVSSHWSSFSEAQKLEAAEAIASWNEQGFWERAESVLTTSASTGAVTPVDGVDAFFLFCFGDSSIVRAVFAKTKDECARPLALAAQMAAAARDDAELATLFTVDAGVAASEKALLRAARAGHRSAFTALLSRADGSTLKGLLSRALVPGDPAVFLSPQAPGFEVPAWECCQLADAGATFEEKHLNEPYRGDRYDDRASSHLAPALKSNGTLFSYLAIFALDNKVSVDRERSFSALALRGALPEASWLSKELLLSREPSLLEFARDTDKNDPTLALASAGTDGMSLRHCGPMAKATISVALAACTQNIDAIHCVHPALVKGLGLTPENAVLVLTKADSDICSINPLRMFSKRAAASAERAAQDAARQELEASIKARSLDFAPLERAIADARLGSSERAIAERALSVSKTIRQSFERSGKGSNLDLADLRRVVEKNLPSLMSVYGATDPLLRDTYDPGSRSTPNKMLCAGLGDALITMQSIGARLDDGARVQLQGEVAVLASKAAPALISDQRRIQSAVDTAAEVNAPEVNAPLTPPVHTQQALVRFSAAVGVAAVSVGPTEDPQRTKERKWAI